MEAVFVQPGPAQHEDVGVAVVVAVGVGEVEAAHLSGEPGALGVLGKAAVSTAAEIAQLVAESPGRGP